MANMLDKLSADVFSQVVRGINLYKRILRPQIPHAVPFFPLGMLDVTNQESPIALGMRTPELEWMAVWRLDGTSRVTLPSVSKKPQILFPEQAGITVEKMDEQIVIEFPRPRNGLPVLDLNQRAANNPRTAPKIGEIANSHALSDHKQAQPAGEPSASPRERSYKRSYLPVAYETSAI